jgi:hypothetical protein
MALSDVWRDISSYIQVYTSNNFEEVPASPGIYAWYYPIKLPSMDINELGEELSSVLNYDSTLKGGKSKTGKIDFNWKKIEINLAEKHSNKFPPGILNKWNELSKNTKLVDDLEKIMLVGSILMPPLYIGKTNNLNLRCHRHRTSSSSEENNFHNRFEQFAKGEALNKKNLLTHNIEDLIFVCIKTDKLEISGNLDTNSEELLEEIFKLYARPPYGEK